MNLHRKKGFKNRHNKCSWSWSNTNECYEREIDWYVCL